MLESRGPSDERASSGRRRETAPSPAGDAARGGRAILTLEACSLPRLKDATDARGRDMGCVTARARPLCSWDRT